jgi:hypothetical protein
MDLSKSFKTDSKARDEGVWVPLPGTDDGTEIRVRSEDYAPYRRAITRIVERQQTTGRFSARQGSRIGDPVEFDVNRAKAIVEHLLLDWKGVTDGGQEIPYSKEEAERYLTDPDFYDFYLAVVEAIERVTRSRADWETARKKSSASASAST